MVVQPCLLTLDNSSKQFQCNNLSHQINDQGNTPSTASNVAHTSLDMIDNSESEHNNTDEESINIDENEADSDDVHNLTNSINRKNIENTKERDKEFSDAIYDGFKLPKISISKIFYYNLLKIL